MTIAIDTPQGIATARKIALVHALALEINVPHMRAARQALLPIAKGYGFKGSRKSAALAFMVEQLQNEIGYEPSASVQRALSK